MTTSSLPLENLADTVVKQEKQLQQMRRELKARQNHLNSLNRTRTQLENQLQKVIQQIERVTRGEALPLSTRTKKTSGSKSQSSPAQPKASAAKTTAKPQTSKAPAPAPSKNGSSASSAPPKAQPASSASTSAPAKAKPTSASTSAPPPAKQEVAPPTLKQSIIEVLKRSRKPLTGNEIAERILQSGYKTTSKDFGKNVSIQAGKMKEKIKLVPGKGYELKR